MKIVIIGKGNVATNLDYAFRKKGVACEMVSSREGLEDYHKKRGGCSGVSVRHR